MTHTTTNNPADPQTFAPWRVVSVDLREPLPTLEAPADAAGLFVVLWCGDVALGHVWIARAAMPVPPQRLAVMAAQAVAPAVGERLLETGFTEPLPMPTFLRSSTDEAPDLRQLLAFDHPLDDLCNRVEQVTHSTNSGEPSVSVIVCTRDRPDDLERCLVSLARLDPPPTQIVVVDNAPQRDATGKIVEQHPEVPYVAEPRPGLSVARNAGIRHSQGDILAWTDDDVEVHPRWIAALRRGFADPQVGVVTGLILPAALDTEAQLWFQGGEGSAGWGYRRRLFDADYFRHLRGWGVPAYQIGAGANMAIRRNAIEQVGLFDERLGRRFGFSEDSEFWYRVLATGRSCLYLPDAVVSHHHRRDWPGLRHQMYQYLRGHVMALTIQFLNHRHIGNLFRAWVLLPVHFVGLVGRTVVYGNARPTLGWLQFRGYCAGWWYAARHLARPRYAVEAGPTSHTESTTPP